MGTDGFAVEEVDNDGMGGNRCDELFRLDKDLRVIFARIRTWFGSSFEVGIVSVGPLKTEIVLLSFIFIPYKGCRTEDIQSNEQGMRLDNAHSF